VGIHVSALDEFQATQAGDTASDSTATLGFDGYAQVIVPAGALSSEAGVILTAGLPELYQDLADPDIELVGEYKKVTLTNGQAELVGEDPSQIVIAYQDEDSNGLVDGTSISEFELVVVRYDEETGTWVTLPSVVDPEQNTVTGQTAHFSLFALSVGEAGPGGGDITDDPADDPAGLFPALPGKSSSDHSSGCWVSPAASGISFLQMLVPLLFVLGIRFLLKRKS